jgi:hypothetical protein
VAHPNAAGIDIGVGSHFVAVRSDADEKPLRELHLDFFEICQSRVFEHLSQVFS